MKKIFKKLLLPVLGFSAVAVSTPIILTSCAKTTNSNNIIDFSKFTSTNTAGIELYGFSSAPNSEWSSKTKEQIHSELNLTNNPAGAAINIDFRDESKFASIINGLEFSTIDNKKLSWSDIDVSALNNPNSKTSIGYTVIGTTSTMIITWMLESKISVVFTLTGTVATPPSQGTL